ncbi:unnamed protein product, partial [marine sediment metagenome]
MQDAYQLASDDRVLQKTPYYFDVSVWEFFWPLVTGARLVIASPGGHQDPSYLAHLVIEQKITRIHFVPSMLEVFLEIDEAAKCHSLKQVICSGEALSPALQQKYFSRLSAPLYNLYGPTEAAIEVTAWRCREVESDAIPIGRPIANMQCYLLDAQQQPVPVGVPGELYLGGVGLARDYLNRPELTAETFIPNPFSDVPGQRLYKTGDLCRYRPDGNIIFLRRLDTQVKLRGMRIELGEIESLLRKCTGVAGCVAVLRED